MSSKANKWEWDRYLITGRNNQTLGWSHIRALRQDNHHHHAQKIKWLWWTLIGYDEDGDNRSCYRGLDQGEAPEVAAVDSIRWTAQSSSLNCHLRNNRWTILFKVLNCSRGSGIGKRDTFKTSLVALLALGVIVAKVGIQRDIFWQTSCNRRWQGMSSLWWQSLWSWKGSSQPSLTCT